MHSAVYPLLTVPRPKVLMSKLPFLTTLIQNKSESAKNKLSLRLIEGTLHCASRSLDGNM